MKILITTDWYRPAVNGVVTSVLNLTAGLEARGHEVRVLTLAAGRRSCVKGNVTYIGSVGVGRIYPGARLKTALSGRYIRELIDWRPDVVHSQCEFSTFFLAKKIAHTCECPLIHTYHTVYEDYTNYFSPSRRVGRKAASAFSNWILRQVTAVVVPTEKVGIMLRGYGVTRPIYQIPTGLDLRGLCSAPSREELDRLRGRFGIGPEDDVLLYLGRLAKEKNIEELFTLLAGEISKRPALRLLLVGGGPYRKALEAKADALGLSGRVIFAGMASPKEVGKYYRLGDVFVSASQSETQGLTYIEAMACGLPLLCRRDDCLDGVVREGETGFTYETPDEFSARLETMLSDPERLAAMGDSAAAAAERNFSEEAFAEKTAEVYEKFVGGTAATDRLSA